MSRVRKAIIPAAGLGTRFLPCTKAMPKEMLPIVDKPTIQYIVEEAIEAGIEDIIIVTGKGKRAIEDHFDQSMELEKLLTVKGKWEDLKEIKRISQLIDIHYVRQKEPLGLGHAVWCARKFIGNEPFSILLGDVIVEQPCLQDLMSINDDFGSSIIGIQNVPEDEVSKYGIVDGEQFTSSTYRVHNLVEKPTRDTAPSTMAIIGRYILTPTIFDILEEQRPTAGNEIQLTDAICKLTEVEPVYAYQFQGKLYDVGDKLEYIKTTIHFALQRPELKDQLLENMREIIGREER
ncbi:UTP--glucose-1-phosphate uridylyltransferase GalU [Brevibacillus sp. SYSU BS000544]|uniref:UTP--glucose-1-phosphate uridylyltransferase GalU n=1 Tax=Brevibacillus sp. SYSU BS000544 TaxID=3416443 RepID=UPI003CE4E938